MAKVKSEMVWKEEKGGYLVVVLDDGRDENEKIELRRRYWLGGEHHILISPKALEAILIECKDMLNLEELTLKLFGVGGNELYYRNRKGQIQRVKARDSLAILFV